MGILTLLAAALLAGTPVPAATVVAAHALPPTPQFRRYDVEQGLPSSNVYTLVQDRRGVIWMGTRDGLVRYDGTRMKVYRHIPGDSTSLAGDDVSAVLTDSRGRLWAGGEGSGVNLFQPATGTFKHYKHDPKDPHSLAGDDIMSMAQGANGTLWVAIYGHGVDHMTSPGHFVHLTHVKGDASSLPTNVVLSLFSRGKGKLWIGTIKGMVIRNADGSLHRVHFQGLSKPPSVWRIDGDAHDVRADTAQGGLFVVGNNGTARRVGAGKLPSTNVFASVRDRQGGLWVGTINGLYLLEPNGRVTYFPPRPLLPGGQPGRLIWQLTLDAEGGLWISTHNGGAAYLSPDWRDFAHYSHRPDDPTSLSASRILALASDGHGNVWVGGVEGQLDKLAPKTGHVTHYGDKLGLAPVSITTLAHAGNGYGLWVGYHGGLGLLHDGQLRKVPAGSFKGNIHWLVANDQGIAFASVAGKGVDRIDPDTLKSTKLVAAFPGEPASETNELVIHDNTLWRASHAGLARLGPDGLHLKAIPGVAAGSVVAMAIRGDNLWLARTHGLEHYRLHDGKATLLKRIGAKQGWPGLETKYMSVDAQGRVWLFAAVGLWRYDPGSGKFRRYGEYDGLPSTEFTGTQLLHLGKLLFAGTLRGVLAFDPSRERDTPRPPKVVLASVVVQRNGHDVRLPLFSGKVHLQWNDRDLRIDVDALSYIDPQRNHYRFRLKGFDPSWVDTGTNGSRELAGLRAGHYTLFVEAAGPSGTWGKLATPLTIDVDAPPWLRPWAWLIYVLVALVLGYLAFAYWHRRITERHRIALAEQQRQLAEEANAAKTRFLATLSHEIRTPMTGVLGMAELLIHGEHEPKLHGYAQAIRHSGELLLKLVNDALDLARIEAGRLELEPAPMDPRGVLGDVRELLQGQALKKGLELDIEVDASVPARLRGDALRIKQILLNLSNNALKFTERGGVYLSASYADGALQLAVRDTGPGISDADRERLFQRFEQADSPERSSGTGLGLAICRELVALMGGRITLDSTRGTGSSFNVSLPLPEVAGGSAERAPAPAAPSGVARRVLLVEDNPTVAATLKGLLEARGHQVTHAAQSLEALTALAGGSFDAMLVDLDLPGMDGYDLARAVRQRDDGRHLPMAAVTARSGGDEEQRARAAGMDDFARKPLSGDELAALVERLCTPRKDANGP